LENARHISIFNLPAGKRKYIRTFQQTMVEMHAAIIAIQWNYGARRPYISSGKS
jgi:hypothetical protein